MKYKIGYGRITRNLGGVALYMKVSQIGLISQKNVKFQGQFPVQDMLLKTGQITQTASGIYSYGHIPYLVEKRIISIMEAVLKKYGISEISLPLLQTEKLWQSSGRLDDYVNKGVMFQCKTENGTFCLAPTAEEAVVDWAKTRFTSHRVLPVSVFQIGNKYRNEIKTRGFLLRGREFKMLDAYSFGRDKEDLEKQYSVIRAAFLEIFQTLELPIVPVKADNGSIGGSGSEEFMYISSMGEDIILFDSNANVAFNRELLEKPETLRDVYGIQNVDTLSEEKGIELGHIFKLGTKYSIPMQGTYTDNDGQKKPYVMGCYGIGVSRTMAMVYEKSRSKDGQGISLPLAIAPYLVNIVPKLDDTQKEHLSQLIYEQMTDAGIPILYDDREKITIGTKIKDSKMLGTPYVAVFGKTLDEQCVEVENNSTGEKFKLTLEEFVTYFAELQNDRSKTLEEIYRSHMGRTLRLELPGQQSLFN